MPLLNTSAILDEIGFLPKRKGKDRLNEILEENGLSLEESIIEVKSIIDNTTDQNLKAKLLDIVLNMHGVKNDKNSAQAPPSIVFVFPSAEPKFLTSSNETIDVEFTKETQKDALLHLSDRSFK